MDNTYFVIHWRIWSNVQSLTVRGAYSVVAAPNRRAARAKLRREVDVHRGEKLIIDNIAVSTAR